jgi:hypothetical protein
LSLPGGSGVRLFHSRRSIRTMAAGERAAPMAGRRAVTHAHCARASLGEARRDARARARPIFPREPDPPLPPTARFHLHRLRRLRREGHRRTSRLTPTRRGGRPAPPCPGAASWQARPADDAGPGRAALQQAGHGRSRASSLGRSGPGRKVRAKPIRTGSADVCSDSGLA